MCGSRALGISPYGCSSVTVLYMSQPLSVSHCLVYLRIPLLTSQPTADKLQVKRGQRVPLNLSTSMCPLFPTSITYMGAMFTTSVVVFIQVGGMTVVANDVLHDTSLLQCSDGSIDTLFQRELRCNMLKIFRTKHSILVRQE